MIRRALVHHKIRPKTLQKWNLQNGVAGYHDMEGKVAMVAMVAASELGNERVFKSAKILTIAPWIFATASAASHAQRFSN